MFRALGGGVANLSIYVDGRRVQVRAGIPLAIALLEAGVIPFRKTPVSGEPRAPVCLMGVCFECLVAVDGRSGVQACMIEVADGMSVRTTSGDALAGVDADV